MPVIRIKRGTSTPTISNLTQTGEMAINTNSDEIFIRSTSGIVKVGGWIYFNIFWWWKYPDKFKC